MFFTKIGNRKKLKKLKKRRPPGTNIDTKLKAHYQYLYTSQGGLHEMRLHKMIIRKFRRRTRRRRFKLLFFFIPNYSYSRKSTNSRMGKGKGRSRRLMALLKSYHPIAAFRGVSINRIKRFLVKTWRRYHLTLFITAKFLRYKK